MIQLIWDAERVGTARADTGGALNVGEHARFSPDDLMATAAASCVMRTFLRLAEDAHVPILSYAATVHTRPACEADAAPLIAIHTYISAPADQDHDAVAALADLSARVSPILMALRDHAVVTADVRLVADTAPAPSPP